MLEGNPYIYEDGTTDAERYLQGCLDGKYVVGNTIKKLATRMLKEIKEGYKGFHYDPDAATRPVEWIETFCMLSSGKLGVPFVLEPYERNIIELIFGFVDDDGLRRFQEALVVIGRKNGKAISVDTDIPTPDGWCKMGDLHVGDKVFGQDGKPSTIIAESEIFDKPTYIVTFEDGATIKATDDHIWTVRNPGGEWYDTTTEGLLGHTDGHGRMVLELEVPLCAPVEYPHRELPYDPYKVGILCASDDEAVPDAYLTASVRQRRALFAGLIKVLGRRKWGDDTYVEVVTKNDVLMSQTKELASSLGVAWYLSDGCPWSMEVYTPGDSGKLIMSIERIPNEPTKCIAIDNPSHLYLAGRNYTATHNTELCAALNLYMLTSDGEGAPQCYNCATNESQASLCFGATWRMVTQSKKLSKYIKKGMVTERKAVGLKYAPNLGYLVTLSRNSDTLDGLNAHYAVLDELAAMRDRSTYDLLKGSLGSQDQPLVFCITTNGKVRDNIFDKQREYALNWLDDRIEDPRFIGILYEMDAREEVEDEAMWPKANPGLGTVKKWDYLRGEMTKAKNDPSYRPEVMTKQFNLPSNQSAAFLTWEAATCDLEWHHEEHKDFKYAIVGMDAADSVDLSAATALMMRPGDDHIYRRSMYWIPEEKLKEGERANAQTGDRLPYREWEANGWLHVVPGNNVPKTVFLEFIQELAAEGIYCRAIGYDQWHMQEIEQQMKYLVGEANVVRVPQWPKNLSDPMKRMRADLEAGRIIWDNPIDTVCNLNVSASVDNNDNYMPIKKFRKSSNRIDGFMSLLDAYIVLMQRYDDYQAAIN